ncbi:MAG: hypothetical protein CW716_05250 [Candidatus Bathyarchaeum sp.]|nr:MAG: hypothetical protein CW716_05250 [Candidatus Bathyarchaeum sp.]
MTKKSELWASLIILLATTVFSVVAFVDWYSLSFFVGSLFFVHWLGIAATLFIAVMIPVYYVLKRKRPRTLKNMLKVHVFGNLISFMLVAIHFAQNTGRLSGLYTRLNFGFVLFLVLAVIVVTGMLERFGHKLARHTRPIHRYSVALFYVVAVIHALQGFNII